MQLRALEPCSQEMVNIHPQLSQSKKSVLISMKSLPNSERFWQYNLFRELVARRRASVKVIRAPCPWPRLPPRLCVHRADRPYDLVGFYGYTFSKASGTRLRSIHGSRGPERTICNSQDSPSAMYLKHLSHTHNIAFSPAPLLRPSPPASKSDVRPCERMDALLTPGIREPEEGPCELGVANRSSTSVSVSG